MQNLLIVVSLAAAVFKHNRRGEAHPLRVGDGALCFDGDTIDGVTIGGVRPLGIDAPETGRGLETPAPFARGPLTRLRELQRAQTDAQAYRRGMWGPPSYTRGATASRLPHPRSQTPSAWRWPALITRP